MPLPFPISASQTDANSPVDETLMDAIRLNLDDHESRIAVAEAPSSNDIRDDFTGTVFDGNLWDADVSGPSVDGIGGTYDHTMTVADNNVGHAVYGGKNTKIRFDLTQERVVIFECRVRGTTAATNRGMRVGFQDASLALGSAFLTDISDHIAIFANNANTHWSIACSSGGVTTTIADVAALNDAFHKFKFRITCSATAGNRLVEPFVDGVALTEIDTNLTTVALRPFFGGAVTVADGSNFTLHVDYFLAYNESRPLGS